MCVCVSVSVSTQTSHCSVNNTFDLQSCNNCQLRLYVRFVSRCALISAASTKPRGCNALSFRASKWRYCFWRHRSFNYFIIDKPLTSGFGGLGVACWSLVPKFAGSNPAEAVGFLRVKKSSARLPSEGK